MKNTCTCLVKKFPAFYEIRKFHDHIHYSLPSDTTRSQFNPVQTPILYFLKIHFNVTPIFLMWSLSPMFSN
jgi:hypothetical protein